MTRGRARRYLLTKQGYYPQVVADAGYSVWDWDASRLSTLFQDSAKTTPVTANSDPVGAWVDGVQGVDAIQATTANKPTYTTASHNGLPTLSFDGGDLLATGNIAISTFAVWALFKANGLTQYPYEHSANSAVNDGMALFTGSNIRVRRNANSAGRALTNPLNDSVYRLIRIEHNGTYATFNAYDNNALMANTATAPADIGTSAATQPLYIGARSNLAGGLIGNIAHLCIVSPYPTAEIIANMESYINGIWGVY